MYPPVNLPPEKMVATLKYLTTEIVVPVDRWSSVKGFRATHGKKLGLPFRSCAMCNGVRVQDSYEPRPGDVISFVELGPCEC